MRILDPMTYLAQAMTWHLATKVGIITSCTPRLAAESRQWRSLERSQ